MQENTVQAIKSAVRTREHFIISGSALSKRISDKIISEFDRVIKTDDHSFKSSDCIRKFKTIMESSYNNCLRELWSEHNLQSRLTKLNELKSSEKRVDVNGKAWRSHGHSVLDQTKDKRVNALISYNLSLDQFLVNSTSRLQKLVLEIERKRKFFRELQKRREMAEKQLQLEIAELERALL